MISAQGAQTFGAAGGRRLAGGVRRERTRPLHVTMQSGDHVDELLAERISPERRRLVRPCVRPTVSALRGRHRAAEQNRIVSTARDGWAAASYGGCGQHGGTYSALLTPGLLHHR